MSQGFADSRSRIEEYRDKGYTSNLADLFLRNVVGDSLESGFVPVNRSSAGELQQSFAALVDRLRQDPKVDYMIQPRADLEDLRFRLVHPHYALVDNPQPEAWRPDKLEFFTAMVEVSGVGDRQGYYIVSDRGVERFDHPVAHFAMGVSYQGIPLEESGLPQSTSFEVTLSPEALLEAVESFRGVENDRAGVIGRETARVLSAILQISDESDFRRRFRSEGTDPGSYHFLLDGCQHCRIEISLHPQNQRLLISPDENLMFHLAGFS